VGVSREIRVLAVRAAAPLARPAGFAPPALISEVVGRPDLPFVRGENAFGKTTATTKNFYICLYSRSSRLLWGSGNTRRNRMGKGCEVGTRFLNPDCPDVRVSENRWIRLMGATGSPKRSTEKPRDTQCCFGGWVEIRTLPMAGAEMEPIGFPRVRHWGQSLQ
jgi:hypothetical protein